MVSSKVRILVSSFNYIRRVRILREVGAFGRFFS